MATKFMTAKEKKQHSREVYDNFIAQADTPVKDFAEMLMQFEVYREDKANGFVCVRVGKRETEMFRFNLCSCTNNPMIILDSWESEPQITVRDGNSRIYNTICTINLALITNILVERRTHPNSTISTVTFTYRNVDYQFTINIDTVKVSGITTE